MSGEAPTCVSVCSGIGGLDHGLARAGFRHLLLCESDPWRRDVLRARFPGVPICDDIRAVGREHIEGAAGLGVELRPGGDLRRGVAVGEPAWGAAADGRGASDLGGRGEARAGLSGGVDLIAGGTPCQGLSVAGRRRGLADDRSGLFFEYARIVGAVRPRWFLWENVPGALSSDGGRDFGIVLGTLADLGYGLAWRVLDSRFFGVPQRRRRVFVVGAIADGDPRAAAERAGAVLAVGSRCSRHPATRGEAREEITVASLSGLGSGGPDDNDGESDTFIAAPLTAGGHPNSNAPGRRKEDDENLVAMSIALANNPISARELAQPSTKRNGDPGVVQYGASVRRLTPTECERLQALPDGWTLVPDSAPDSRRYAGLGDAVTSSVAEWIGSRIVAVSV